MRAACSSAAMATSGSAAYQARMPYFCARETENGVISTACR